MIKNFQRQCIMNKLLEQLYESNIQEIEAIRKLSIEYNMINEQPFLNWLDKLNEYSLDPEQ